MRRPRIFPLHLKLPVFLAAWVWKAVTSGLPRSRSQAPKGLFYAACLNAPNLALSAQLDALTTSVIAFQESAEPL